MTNKEKFKEIFGIEPDCGRCNPYPCEENDCKYWEQCENQPGCACDDWWDWEFEEPTTKNDLGVTSELEKNSKKLEKDFGELDCISRADALALYCDKCPVYNCISKCSSYRAVEKMPSVTPQEPRKGHWTDTNTEDFVYHRIYKCSHCGNTVCDYPENIKKYKYCSNCGAKMVEPQESEDKK